MSLRSFVPDTCDRALGEVLCVRMINANAVKPNNLEAQLYHTLRQTLVDGRPMCGNDSRVQIAPGP